MSKIGRVLNQANKGDIIPLLKLAADSLGDTAKTIIDTFQRLSENYFADS